MKPRYRILIVDDEANLRRALEAGLRRAGFDADSAADGDEAMKRLAERAQDAIVLDINMPGADGFELIPRIRLRSNAPILMLTARTDVSDKIDALGCGADDYMTKPFILDELSARLTAHLRRRPLPGETITFQDLEIDVGARKASRAGAPLDLSAREFDLLVALAREQGRVFRKSQLLDTVWGPQAEITTETVDRFISLLRAKLEAGDRPRLIATVRGVGYALRAGEDE